MANKNQWKRIPWDGNVSLGYECWRKNFGNGHVSVGIGDFMLISFSYGPNSDESMSSTRSRMLAYGTPDITEKEAMAWIDACDGKYKQTPKRKS